MTFCSEFHVKLFVFPDPVDIIPFLGFRRAKNHKNEIVKDKNSGADQKHRLPGFQSLLKLTNKT